VLRYGHLSDGTILVSKEKIVVKPKILVYASGTKTGGGSGAQWLVEASRVGILDADICAVISNHYLGGVHNLAQKLAITDWHMDTGDGIDASSYAWFQKMYNPDLVALSGWIKPVYGLDPRTTINIHPGLLPRFGGKGMYGHHVHETVVEANNAGEISCTAVSMHFVLPFVPNSEDDKYDKGPVFFQMPVALRYGDTADDIARRVNEVEHSWQAYITNLVVHGEISWDGVDPASLKVPDWYTLNRPIDILGYK
jgi:folate-dependent phosphoribosylglycinamide formyltransferase PurN